jgi:hypothetical protein
MYKNSASQENTDKKKTQEDTERTKWTNEDFNTLQNETKEIIKQE